MEHEEAVRLQMTEQYLLDELSPEAREEFEEHYFDCRECAADVGAGAIFARQAKSIFAEERDRAGVPVPPIPPHPITHGWRAWFRPVLLAPIMLIFFAAAGYQNFVMVPAMERALNTPQVLPVASLNNIGTFGGDAKQVPAQSGRGFLLDLKIPPQDSYASYSASLYNPGQKVDGKPEWTVAVPSALVHNPSAKDSSRRDRFAVQVPGAKRLAGTYTVVVLGIKQSGDSEEIGRESFEFQEP
jgi:hypothetical protein